MIGALLLWIPKVVQAVQDDTQTAPYYALEGELSIGQRAVQSSGDQESAEAATNMDTGPFLRSLRLEGRGHGTLFEHFELDASGLGDPFARARFSAERGAWHLTSAVERSRLALNTTSDLHPFDIERRGATLGLHHETAGLRAGFDIAWSDRDGLSLTSRSVDFDAIAGIPRNSHERSFDTRGAVSAELSWGRLDWSVTTSHTTERDGLFYSSPSPTIPTEDVIEDYDAATRGRTLGTSLRLTREAANDAWRVDGGVSLQGSEGSGGFSSFTTGFFFDPSLPFEKLDEGQLSRHSHGWKGDLGAVRTLGPDLDLELRYFHDDEHARGQLDSTSTLDELMGDPPSVFQSLGTSSEDERSDTLELSLYGNPHEALDFDWAVSAGRSALVIDEVVEDVTTRTFDDSLAEYGTDLTLGLHAPGGLDLDLEGGYGQRPTETAEPGVEFRFADQRSYYAGLKSRWQASPSLLLDASARHDGMDSDAFDAHERVDHYTLAAQLDATEELALGASIGLTTFALDSTTTFNFFDPLSGTQTLPALVEFNSLQRTATLTARWDATPTCKPTLALSGVDARGDSHFQYTSLALALPWQATSRFQLGLEATVLDFHAEDSLAPGSFRTGILSAYVRTSF